MSRATEFLWSLASLALLLIIARSQTLAAECQDAPLNLIVQESVALPITWGHPGVEPDPPPAPPFTGMLTDQLADTAQVEFTVTPGDPVQKKIFGAVVAQDAQVQGWAVSVALDGGVVVTEATVFGTSGDVNAARHSSAVADGGGASGMFEFTEVVAGGRGAISAVVTGWYYLGTTGTHTILSLTVEPESPLRDAPVQGQLVWRDGLQGSGKPIDNLATVDGSTAYFCHRQEAHITFLPAEFIRADANLDQRLDVSDPVTILRSLFSGDVDAFCDDASDSNDDGAVDVSDAAFVFNYLFLGGPAPRPPFPQPATDPTPDGLGCGT